MKIFSILAESYWKTEIEPFPHGAISHEYQSFLIYSSNDCRFIISGYHTKSKPLHSLDSVEILLNFEEAFILID